jgi:xanthine dehydrogenase accessory factor
MADISLDQLPVSLAGPAGLHLGGDLPEGIALAILAECHAAIHRVDAHSISGLFDPNV